MRILRRIVTLICCGAAPVTGLAQAAWIGPADNAFGAGLYGKLAAGNQGNLFFSPNSIETALAMTDAGARGETAREMAAVLHLPPGTATVHQDFGAYLAGLCHAPNGGYELSVANALWGQKGTPFLPDFLSLLKTSYSAPLMEVDFIRDSEGARAEINAWVARQTREKITDLIGPRVLTADTRLVLTNAIYFKGKWDAPFDKAATRDEPFHLPDGTEKNVPTMRRTGSYGYMENADFQALELRYEGNRLSMIILLPRQANGLAALEKQLTAARLAEALAALDERAVVVSIPKFKIAASFELAPALRSMGMRDAFGAGADFSGMTGDRSVAISNVIHKACVDVNEEGTEAAAATGVVIATAIARPLSPPVFHADHPFFFGIRDEESGAFLFMGRMTN